MNSKINIIVDPDELVDYEEITSLVWDQLLLTKQYNHVLDDIKMWEELFDIYKLLSKYMSSGKLPTPLDICHHVLDKIYILLLDAIQQTYRIPVKRISIERSYNNSLILEIEVKTDDTT